jgi:23S rRNA (uracil1939-C5)-methyltransferase
VVSVHRLINDQPGPVVITGNPEHLFGKEAITERVAGIEFRLSPTSFFQTSVAGAEILVELVLGILADDPGDVLDVYSGVGLFSLPLAQRGCRVVGVEVNRKAVADAKAAARANGVSERCTFLAAPAERLLDRLPPGRTFQHVILDPPREGCPENVLKSVVRLHPRTIICVSCEPQALARELGFLCRTGYRLRFVQPVDMFPHTSQIEAVAVLDRVFKKSPKTSARPRAQRPSKRRR